MKRSVKLFERRLEMRIDVDNETMREGFLAMYANPVVNKLNYKNDLSKPKILLIYTGGTIGMVKDFENRSLNCF